jgi:NDP-sugar pyrophosphorylase family protein
MRDGKRREFQTTPKVLLRIWHDGKSASLFAHAMHGILSLSPGAISVLASRHPRCGAELILEEISKFRETQRIAVHWDPLEKEFGTARALYQAAHESSFPVLVVVTADTIFPFRKLPLAVELHRTRKAGATWIITTKPGPMAQNSGCLLFDPEKGRLSLSKEGAVFPSGMVTGAAELVEGTSTGTIIFSSVFYRDRFAELRRRFCSGPIDIYHDLMPFLLNRGDEISVFDVAEPTPDLGTPERFIRFGQSAE